MLADTARVGGKPAIDDVTHGKPALAEPESERLLFTAIAGAALHANRHVLTIPRSLLDPDLLAASFAGPEGEFL